MIRSKGFTIVEFLIASALILTVLIFSALALDSNAKVITVDRARDAATSLGYQVLDKARLYGCGNITGDPSARAGLASPGGRDEVVTKTRCDSIFDAAISPTLAAEYKDVSTGSSFSGVVYDSLNADRPYLVTLDFEYDTEDGQMCSVADIGKGYVAPSVVRYVLNIHWMVRSEMKTTSLVTSEPLPADFSLAQNGVLVKFPSTPGKKTNKTVTLSLKQNIGASTLKPAVTRSTTSDCVWFSNFGELNTFSEVAVGVKGGTQKSIPALSSILPRTNTKIDLTVAGGS